MASFNYGSERASLDEQYDLLGRFADSHAVFSKFYESLSDAARASIAGARHGFDAGHGVEGVVATWRWSPQAWLMVS